jgi:hypothetical protein
MKKLIVSMLVLLVAVGAVVGAWFFWRGRRRTPSRGPELRAMMRDVDAPRPIEPSIGLQVNETREATVFSGTPVWFTVNANNTAAINELAAAPVLAAKLAALTEDVAQGKASPRELERLRAVYEQRRAPATIRLGDAARPWTAAVQFLVRDEKGSEQPLSFEVKPLGNLSSTVELDAVNSTEASFGTASANVIPGTYSIVACLGATGSWQGRVCSGPVKLSVLARPEHLTPEQQEALDRQSARFGLLVGDYQAVENYGRKLVGTDPSSIPGHIYLGEAKFGQQKWSEALEEYTTARAEFNRQHPDAVERPQLLNARINQLLEKLSKAP